MIDFGTPFNKAWQRTESILFRPFEIGKWFVLGFSAWLASFIHDQGLSLFNANPGGGGNSSRSSSSNHAWLDNLDSFGHHFNASAAGAGGVAHGGGALAGTEGIMIGLLVAAAAVIILLVVLVMYWLGARGQFMFLDNVLHRRAEVVRPWREFKRRGNRLFLFMVVMGLIVIVATLAVVAVCLFGFLHTAFGTWSFKAFDQFQFIKHWPAMLAWIAPLVAHIIVLCGAYCLYLDFAVPIMYRQDCGAWAAAGKVWNIFWQKPWDCLLYLLVRLGMSVMFNLLALLLCCICCFTILPYLNAVATLPYRVFRFGFTMEYLSQFGPEYSLTSVKF